MPLAILNNSTVRNVLNISSAQFPLSYKTYIPVTSLMQVITMDTASSSASFNAAAYNNSTHSCFIENDSTRQVEHFLITWTINDFLKLKGFGEKPIISPPIQISVSSDKWFITVFPDFLFAEENEIQLSLRRDASNGESAVVVTYRFGIKKSKTTWFEERLNVIFPFNGSSLVFFDILEYFGDQNALLEQDLTVLCEMYINYKPDIDYLREKKASDMETCLLGLSLDLFNLSKKTEESDAIVQVKDFKLPVHKAILAARSAVFAEMLMDNDSHIICSDDDYNHIYNILIYMYSANFYLITMYGICIGLYECAKRYKVHGLTQLLTPAQIYVSSLIKEKEISFVWEINNFSNLKIKFNECVTSPPFHAGSKTAPVWYLDIYPYGCHRAPNDIGIFLRTKDMKKISYLKIHISILDELKLKNYTKTAHEPLYPDLVYGFPEFVSKRELQEKKLLRDDKLIINCNIISLSLIESYDKISSVSQPSYKEYPCFQRLSADMEDLLLDGYLSDCVLMVSDTVMFYVHRVILSARSDVFDHIIKKAKLDNYIVSINDVSTEVLQEIIYFCYTARVGSYSSSFCIKLYEGAKRYKIMKLAKKCVTALLYTTEENNLCEVVAFSHKYKETELFSRCLMYLKMFRDRILNSEEWQNFVEKEEDLAYEIFKWLEEPIDKPLSLKNFF